MSFELAFIVLLIVGNAVFAMSEIAVISSRKARLERHAREGRTGARAALELASKPTDFLATVQVGITLIGVLAGAYGGATVVDTLAARLQEVPALARYANALALGVVVAAITYFTLVIGELVPKRLALNHPERLAAALAKPMRLLAQVMKPLVRLLSGSTSVVLWLLRARPSSEPEVTEEEIKLLIAQGTKVGTFEVAEQEIVERVFRLGDRHVAQLMTPRRRIVWLDVNDSPQEIARKIVANPFSRYPVAEGSLDTCQGFVRTRDLLSGILAGGALDLRSCLRQPLLLPENTRMFTVMERFRSAGVHLAMVIDEYGGIEGLVTLNDVLEAIMGDMPAADEHSEPAVVRREDGSWLVDGSIPAADLKETLGLSRLPAEDRGGYRTVGGLVMHQLGRVPSTGDHFTFGGFRFEVVDMDGRLVDKVLISTEPPAEPDERG